MRLERRLPVGSPYGNKDLVAAGPDLLALLKLVTKEKSVTFVYAASDEERNSALALKELLERGKK